MLHSSPTSHNRFSLWIAALVTVAGLWIGARPAVAQNFAGRFTLPFQARWGNVDLQPGNYVMRTTHTIASRMQIFVISDEAEGKPVGQFIAAARDPLPESDQNILVCVRRGQRHVVQSLWLGNLGEIVTFQIAKDMKALGPSSNFRNPTLIADASRLIRLPVEIAAK